MNQANTTFVALLASALLPTMAYAESGDEVVADPYLDARYRLEIVSQDGFTEDAFASTLRLKGGVVLGEWNGLSTHVETEAILRVGPDDFNDTVNGRIAYPVVADPSDFQLNQAFIRWNPSDVIDAKAGRQAVNIDNQRWIGSVGWRQNDQTLDAVRAISKPTKGLELEYLYGWRVNRIFGPDSPQGVWRDNNIHAARAAYSIKDIGTVSGFGYLLDIPDSPASSSKTFGVRFVGAAPLGSSAKLLYAAAYANQKDYGANPFDYSADYWMVEPGFSVSGFTVKGGIEHLGGNGNAAVQAPLATLHAFNGWSDKFLRTPTNGLQDVYGDIAYKFSQNSSLKGLGLKFVYHDFKSTTGGLHYGSEIDAQISYPVSKNVSILAKYADYNAKDFATDTRKFWFQLQSKF